MGRWVLRVRGYSVQFSTQSCPTLCDPMNCSTPGLCVHHQLLEFIQTHIHRVNDAIQPSHPLSSASPSAPNPSQHQSFFQWVNSSHKVAKLDLEKYKSDQGKGDDRGWDGCMASLTRWMWVWMNSRSWWWTGRPGVLQFIGLQRVGHKWLTELNWTDPFVTPWTVCHQFLLFMGFSRIRIPEWVAISFSRWSS